MNQKTAVFGIILILAVSITGKLYLESQIEQDITAKIAQAVADLSQPEVSFTVTHDPVNYSLLSNTTTINNMLVEANSEAFSLAQSQIENIVIVDYQEEQGIGEIALSNAVINIVDNQQQTIDITLAKFLVKDITQAYMQDMSIVSQSFYQLAHQVISVEQFEEKLASTFNTLHTPFSEITMDSFNFALNGEVIAGIKSISQLNSQIKDGIATKSVAEMQEMTLSFTPFTQVNPQLPMMIEAYLGKPVEQLTLDMASQTELDDTNLIGVVTLSERNTLAMNVALDIDNVDVVQLFELQQQFKQTNLEPQQFLEQLLNDPAIENLFMNDITLTLSDNGMVKHHINSTPGLVDMIKQQMQLSAPMLDAFQAGLSEQLVNAIDTGVAQDEMSLSVGVEQKPNTQMKNALQVQAPMMLNQFFEITIAN